MTACASLRPTAHAGTATAGSLPPTRGGRWGEDIGRLAERLRVVKAYGLCRDHNGRTIANARGGRGDVAGSPSVTYVGVGRAVGFPGGGRCGVADILWPRLATAPATELALELSIEPSATLAGGNNKEKNLLQGGSLQPCLERRQGGVHWRQRHVAAAATLLLTSLARVCLAKQGTTTTAPGLARRV